MYYLKVISSFDAAHRLGCGYEGKCSVPHGHSWKVVVTLKFNSLKGIGFAEDFKDIKRNLNLYLNKLDHSFLIPKEDIDTNDYFNTLGEGVIYFQPNPTAEIISETIYKWMERCGYEVESVELWETDKNCCIYKEE